MVNIPLIIKKMAYLIVKCEALGDQCECDANRTPMFMCDSWYDLRLPYAFDVYALKDDNTFELVKDYETPMEWGMALYYWRISDDCEGVKPTVIQKWNHRTRDEHVPKKAKQAMIKGTDIFDNLKSCGAISWCKGKYYYVYGEYQDNFYSLGY